jgi:hypothetical protein
MTWLIWQQQRRLTIAVVAALAAAAAFLLPTGIHLSDSYHSALRTCAASGGCSDLYHVAFGGDSRMFDIVGALGLLLPFVLGLFWGAPLIGREIEEGTHRLAWTQSVTRLRWLGTKLLWVFAAAVLCTASLSALVTWWYGPVNSVQMNRFGTVVFDTQGIVPVAYAVFGVALGTLLGATLRRTVLAMAATFGIFGVLRYVIDQYVRPHLMPAKSLLLNLDAASSSAPAGNGS